MKFILLFILAQSSFAYQLVHRAGIVKELKEVKGPIYKTNIFRSEFTKSKLLNAIGPFVKHEGEYQRFYRFLDKCYQVSFEGNDRLIKTKSCQKIKEIYASLTLEEHPGFNRISLMNAYDLIQPATLEQRTESFSYDALVHSYRVFKADTEVLGDVFHRFPKIKYHIDMEYTSEIKMEKGLLVFEQALNVKTSKHGIISSKESKKLNKYKLGNNSFYFSDGQGRLIIIPAIRTVLPEVFMKLSNKFLTYVDNYQEELYSKDGESYCFKRDYYQKHQYDCQSILSTAPSSVNFHRILELRIEKGQLEWKFEYQ